MCPKMIKLDAVDFSVCCSKEGVFFFNAHCRCLSLVGMCRGKLKMGGSGTSSSVNMNVNIRHSRTDFGGIRGDFYN